MDEFCHGYANQFFQHFLHGNLDQEPIFSRCDKSTLQSRSLKLSSKLVVQQLFEHIKYCDSIFEKLPGALKVKDSWVSKEFNKVRSLLSKRVLNYKNNTLRIALLHYLIEIMPTTEAQRKVLPVLKIDIDNNLSIHLHTRIRTCGRQKRMGLSNSLLGSVLLEQIAKLRIVRDWLCKKAKVLEDVNGVVRGVIAALGANIVGKASTLDEDTKVLNSMAKMMAYPD